MNQTTLPRPTGAAETAIPARSFRSPLTCPLCQAHDRGSDTLTEGTVRIHTTYLSRLMLKAWEMTCRFHYGGNRSWLILSTGGSKQALRCTDCGTTVILRGK